MLEWGDRGAEATRDGDGTCQSRWSLTSKYPYDAGAERRVSGCVFAMARVVFRKRVIQAAACPPPFALLPSQPILHGRVHWTSRVAERCTFCTGGGGGYYKYREGVRCRRERIRNSAPSAWIALSPACSIDRALESRLWVLSGRRFL